MIQHECTMQKIIPICKESGSRMAAVEGRSRPDLEETMLSKTARPVSSHENVLVDT